MVNVRMFPQRPNKARKHSPPAVSSTTPPIHHSLTTSLPACLHSLTFNHPYYHHIFSSGFENKCCLVHFLWGRACLSEFASITWYIHLNASLFQEQQLITTIFLCHLNLETRKKKVFQWSTHHPEPHSSSASLSAVTTWRSLASLPVFIASPLWWITGIREEKVEQEEKVENHQMRGMNINAMKGVKNIASIGRIVQIIHVLTTIWTMLQKPLF